MSIECKGSWVLGTACGACQKCSDNMPEAVEVIRVLRNENSDLRAAAKFYQSKMQEAVKILNT